jgi:hypothetical protein
MRCLWGRKRKNTCTAQSQPVPAHRPQVPSGPCSTQADHCWKVLQVLRDWLPRLWREHRPQLVIFQAGVDALEEDAFGRSAAVSASCALPQTWE